MDIGWPQIIYLALMSMRIGIALANHGEPAPKYSVGYTLIGTVLALALLWWGGFFS